MGKYITLIYDEPYTSEHVGENIYRMVNSTKTFTATELATLFTPYTEPDMEQVRKEAYDKGYDDAAAEIGSNEQQAIAEKAYQKGLSDAWECARKISCMAYNTCDEIFGLVIAANIFNENIASEAIEKIRAYEQAQKEKEEQMIQVGDEVIYDGRRCVVITPETTKRYGSLMDAEGRRHGFENKEVEKTGRHFSEIAEVFAKMKEKE